MTLRRALRRLRLKPGDGLLVHRSIPINAVQNLGRNSNLNFSVPIIMFENKNDFRRLPFEEMERIYLEAKKVRDGGL